MKIKQFINFKNNQKKLFTPGPGSLIEENILGLEPCFGRNDKRYEKIENFVLNRLKKMSGQKNIVRLQGSASLALEIGIFNFISGNVLVIDSGFYSDRLKKMCKNLKNLNKKIKKIDAVNWRKIKNIKKKYDWIISCVTETSIGITIPIKDLYKLKLKCRSKLFLDATASIGLEKDHRYGDVVSFSSCKGLLGLTGASFISYNAKPANKIKSFYFDIKSHEKKLMTGPYHAIGSLYYIIKNFERFKFTIKINKKRFLEKYGNLSPYEKKNQPFLCTYISKKVRANNRKVILYKPRVNLKGSVICHLGEAHLKEKAKGKIINYLKV